MTVQGTVVKSKLARRYPLSTSIPPHWSVFVEYAYDIDGSQLVGNQWWKVRDTGKEVQTGLSVTSDDLTKAERRSIIARYAPGAAVSVHYFPSDPNGAWLRPRPSLRLWGDFGVPLAIAGVMTLGVGVWVVVGYFGRW